MAGHAQDLSPPATELGRLNDPERRVLALLAEGHTVKSIAQATGWTVPAVNERLRAARRKTGIGSSRELARRYAQENRHDDLGLAEDLQIGLPDRASSETAARQPWKGPRIMALVVAAAIAATLMFHNASAPKAEQDPILGNILAEDDTRAVFDAIEKAGSKSQDIQEVLAGEGSRDIYRRLHAQVRDEKRDQRWAEATEASLDTAYRRALPPGTIRNESRVICAASLCEIAIATIDAEPKAVTAFYDHLQSQPWISALEAAGLKNLTTMFVVANPNRHIYISYWRRSQTS